MKPRIAFALFAVVVAAVTAFSNDADVGQLPPPSDKKDLTFEKDIKPMFEKSCIECHSAEKPKGKLRLDTLAGTLKGSVDGKVLEPGNSAKSFLVANIAFLGNEDDFMPPPRDEKQ